MNIQDAQTFVLEEVTPERMALVDRLITEDARAGRIRDNRSDYHRFRCAGCLIMAQAIDFHIGFTQHIIPCPWCSMPAGDVDRNPLKRYKVTHQLPHDVEFFRPLEPEEVDWYIDGTIEAGIIAARHVPGCDPDDPEDELRIATQNASATRVLHGLLLPRPVHLKDTKGG